MRYKNGWIKIHRELTESDISQNAYLFSIWIWLLCHATYKESKILHKGKQRVIPAGTTVFGMGEVAEKWECSIATVHKWVHYLHDTERVVLETGTRGSIATICNWEKYQIADEESRMPSEHEVNAARMPAETYEESKKERIYIYANFLKALEEYKCFPGVTKGPKAEAKFKEQITSEDLFTCLMLSIKNYRNFLASPDNNWRKPKTSFDTFLGSKSRGFFWRDFINPVVGSVGTRPKQLTLDDIKAMKL